jgi:hypothetical protein
MVAIHSITTKYKPGGTPAGYNSLFNKTITLQTFIQWLQELAPESFFTRVGSGLTQKH